MKQKEHLPFFGIGPYYVGAIAVITAVGMILSRKGYLDSGLIPALKTPMLAPGPALHLLGPHGRYDEAYGRKMAQ